MRSEPTRRLAARPMPWCIWSLWLGGLVFRFPCRIGSWGPKSPCLVNLQPSGEFLMEDFYYAGGLPVALRELGHAGLLPS